MRYVRFVDPTDMVRMGKWRGDHIHTGDRRYDPRDVNVLPPTEPSKIVCAGLNYASLVEEMGLEPPEKPSLFVKPPNTVAGHGSTVTIPAGKRVEHEAEIAVVVAEQCRDVPRERAMEVVWGFTCLNDVSNRDDQWPEEGGHRDMVRGKSFDGAAPVGPVIATPDELPDDPTLTLAVDGEVRQRASMDDMIFGVPRLIEAITEYVTLERGDVVSTGAPAGADRLTDGDEVSITLEGVGTLKHGVVEG